jgi:hypothetical protein
MSAYEAAAAKTRAYYEENYMHVFDPVSKVKMSVLKDMGKVLLSLGWEIPPTNRPINPDDLPLEENDEDTYYDDSIEPSVTERITKAVTTMLPSDLITEMSTEGAVTDMMTEVISDLVSNTNSTVSMWDGLVSDGASVASLTGEQVTNVTMNVAEEIMRINTTDREHEVSSLSFKRFRDFPAFLPGPLQISLLLLIASAAMLCASE